MNNKSLLIRSVTLFSLLLLPFLTLSAELSGIVYVDLNKNRQKESNEKGVAGVPVSDGLNVVLTDINGRYLLPGTPKSRFVYLTLPSGYKTIDRFYIRTDGRTSGYDFGLTPFPQSSDKKVRFIQLADAEAGCNRPRHMTGLHASPGHFPE